MSVINNLLPLKARLKKSKLTIRLTKLLITRLEIMPFFKSVGHMGGAGGCI